MTVFKNKTAWFLVILLAGLSLFVFGGPVWVKLTGSKLVEQAVAEIRSSRPFTFDDGKWSGLVLLGLKEERSLEVWGRIKSGELELIKSITRSLSSAVDRGRSYGRGTCRFRKGFM